MAERVTVRRHRWNRKGQSLYLPHRTEWHVLRDGKKIGRVEIRGPYLVAFASGEYYGEAARTVAAGVRWIVAHAR